MSARMSAHMSAHVSGHVRVPGSKSLSNRHLILAALADAPTTLRGLLACEDCDRLLAALSALGARHRAVRGPNDGGCDGGCDGDRDQIIIEPAGSVAMPNDVRVDLGDGGTPTRFMIAYAAARRAGVCTIDGSARMRERPVAEGVDMLRALGARISYVEQEGRLPVRVEGGSLRGGRLRVGRTASSQFASALMLVAPTLAEGLDLEFTEEPTSASYLQLSLAALAEARVQAEVEYRPVPVDSVDSGLARIRIAPQRIGGGAVSIEPDASSAVYPAAAAALVGGRVLLEGLPRRSVQPDAFFLEDLALRGVRLEESGPDATPLGGSIRGLVVESRGVLRGRDADYSSAPDAAVMAMVLAAACDRPSRFTGLRTLRVKESDRIAAVASGLRAIGGTVETGEDWVLVHPLPSLGATGTALEHASSTVTDTDIVTVIDTVNDHRIAMAFAILGLRRPGIAIANPACVAKSWPGFWQMLDLLRGAVPGENAPR
ncbi:MAG: 3-phosphoshikimate 1-carboxyvinyltransferase [bacterium]